MFLLLPLLGSDAAASPLLLARIILLERKIVEGFSPPGEREPWKRRAPETKETPRWEIVDSSDQINGGLYSSGYMSVCGIFFGFVRGVCDGSIWELYVVLHQCLKLVRARSIVATFLKGLQHSIKN